MSTGEFGLALLGVAVGSIISLPTAGWLIAHYGSKPVTLVSSIWFCLVLAGPAFAASGRELWLALFVLGLAAGAMDVSMNAQGVAVERWAKRPMMSGFHAMFSIGGMAGAAVGGLIAKAGVSVRAHFCFAAILFLATILAASRGLLPGSADSAPGRRVFHLSPEILGLGILTLCFFLSEGAMADWTAIYLREFLRAGPAQAASGYACFSATMALGRMVGDPLRSRFGAATLVRSGSVLAAVGIALALVSPSVTGALAGFAMVGFGSSVIVPIAFVAAGNAGGGGGLSLVATMGYFGLFIGPPVIGFAAEAVTLRRSLALLIGLLLSGLVFARLGKAAETKRDALFEEAENAEHPKPV